MAYITKLNVPVIDLIEYISVETVVIKSTHDQHDDELNFLQKPGSQLLSSRFQNTENFDTLNKKITIEFGCQVTPELNDIGVNTSRVSSEQQSFAIQCALSDEWDEDSIIMTIENNDIVQKNFKEFVKNKSNTHANDIYECTFCGEISKGSEELNNHMTLHWGPDVLCSKCGRLFESAAMHARHSCGLKIRRFTNLLCPHTTCPVIKFSMKNKHKRRRCCTRDPYERFKSKRLIKRIFDCKGIKRTKYVQQILQK